MTVAERTERSANFLVENSYLKLGTVLAVLSAMATLIWQASQVLHRLERVESEVRAAQWERWSRVSMERWSNDLERGNPDMDVPDPYDQRYGLASPFGKGGNK